MLFNSRASAFSVIYHVIIFKRRKTQLKTIKKLPIFSLYIKLEFTYCNFKENPVYYFLFTSSYFSVKY
jgi:hypothetical protein